MGQIVSYVKQHRLVWALGVSLALHLILLLFSARGGNEFFLQPPRRENEAPERRIAFEIIETPEDSRLHPTEETHLLSDRFSTARNRYEGDLERGSDPYADGISDVRSLSSPSGSGDAGAARFEDWDNRSNSSNRTSSRQRNASQTFSREILTGRGQGVASSSASSVPYRQTRTRAQDFGSLRFNTYAWDFAPYLLYLKEIIGKNIYPPPVFTHMGFGGRNMIRFQIYPDGRLEGVAVLGHQGEQALVETSVMAVRVSAPFHPLPSDFPEDFLEVTAAFHYIGFQR